MTTDTRVIRPGYRGKRILDLGLVVLTAPVWIPLLIVVALCVRVALGSPILFVQERPGWRGQPFRLMKFRSMRDAFDERGPLPDAQRLTRFGRFLRSTSLDELPELVNVLRGDMSLVGPRPLLMQYLPLYSPRQGRRHEVRPGITGWAQINGRNLSSWPERFEQDVWYVDHASFSLDCRILASTLSRVVAREGIAHPGAATMPPFSGGSDARD
ncbi:MAG TPA: sugar transferase [Gemmatimonadaceae bacterium]|nr:sugar transferase [Gemmatimonadaceae bacterium]